METKIVIVLLLIALVLILYRLWKERGTETFEETPRCNAPKEPPSKEVYTKSYKEDTTVASNSDISTFPVAIDIGVGDPNAYFFEMPDADLQKQLDTIATDASISKSGKYVQSDVSHISRRAMDKAVGGLLTPQLKEQGFYVAKVSIKSIYENELNNVWLVYADVVLHRPVKQHGKVVYFEARASVDMLDYMKIQVLGSLSEDMFAIQSFSGSSWSSSMI